LVGFGVQLGRNAHRVHPTHKTKYRVANWASYDRALVGRGDVTLWVSPEAIATWEPVGVGTRGGQQQYSDVAIETVLTLRLLFHLPLRQAEGFVHALFGMMGLALSAPDHTTLSRRGQRLDVRLRRVQTGKGLHLIVDSTGLSIVGEGEWARAKHGVRRTRGWKKLHLGVDRTGVIVAYALRDATVDDAATAIEFVSAVAGGLTSVTGDAAFDTIACYETATARGAIVVVPPDTTARVSRRGPRSSARDRPIKKIERVGRPPATSAGSRSKPTSGSPMSIDDSTAGGCVS
jgi:IS5 family transposase